MKHHGHMKWERLTYFALAVVLLLGCGPKSEEEDEVTTGDICADDCRKAADQCPSDSQAATVVEHCETFCRTYVLDSEECTELHATLVECLAANGLTCEGGSYVPPCGEYFVEFGYGTDGIGLCIDPDTIE